jgi:hypothetical protein
MITTMTLEIQDEHTFRLLRVEEVENHTAPLGSVVEQHATHFGAVKFESDFEV